MPSTKLYRIDDGDCLTVHQVDKQLSLTHREFNIISLLDPHNSFTIQFDKRYPDRPVPAEVTYLGIYASSD